MDSRLGICGKDWVILAADASVAYSIMKLKKDEDKIYKLNDTSCMSVAGETCDRERFSSYIQRNLAWQYYKNGYHLDLDSTAEYTRSELAEALRKGPYQVSVLIAGVEDDGAKLYWMDYLGTLQRVTKAAHGYAGYFCSSTLDNQYHPDMTKEEGLGAIKKCINELKVRFLIDQPVFKVKVMTKTGTGVIDL